MYHSVLIALRPRQWTKNLIVFAAPLFAFQLNGAALRTSVLAFVLFSCVSSGFYLINDVLDVEADRRHPVKRLRPIAAGKLPIPIALLMAGVLLVHGLVAAWCFKPHLGLVISGYVLLQVAYNLRLKHLVILDIIAIAAGFVLRAYGGAIATDIRLSAWFLLCTAMLALFLGIEKRKAELRLAELKGQPTRAVLRAYSLELLSRMESTVTTGAIMSYAIWSSGPQVNGAKTPWMLLTLPFVLYGIFRYQWLSDPQATVPTSSQMAARGTERPEEILLTDGPILLTVMAWIMTTIAMLTLKSWHWIA